MNEEELLEALFKERAEATRLRTRQHLGKELCKVIRSWGVSQRVAAKMLSTNKSRVNDLLNGKSDGFTVDALLVLCDKVDLEIKVNLFPRKLRDDA